MCKWLQLKIFFFAHFTSQINSLCSPAVLSKCAAAFFFNSRASLFKGVCMLWDELNQRKSSVAVRRLLRFWHNGKGWQSWQELNAMQMSWMSHLLLRGTQPPVASNLRFSGFIPVSHQQGTTVDGVGQSWRVSSGCQISNFESFCSNSKYWEE